MWRRNTKHIHRPHDRNHSRTLPLLFQRSLLLLRRFTPIKQPRGLSQSTFTRPFVRRRRIDACGRRRGRRRDHSRRACARRGEQETRPRTRHCRQRKRCAPLAARLGHDRGVDARARQNMDLRCLLEEPLLALRERLLPARGVCHTHEHHGTCALLWRHSCRIQHRCQKKKVELIRGLLFLASMQKKTKRRKEARAVANGCLVCALVDFNQEVDLLLLVGTSASFVRFGSCGCPPPRP
jgi:hypothetical protein